jgi:heme-degrading monooxygenase HmoA
MTPSMQFVLICIFISNVAAFQLSPRTQRASSSIVMHFEEALLGNTALAKDALKAERYVATNRFNVRKGKEAKFEKRWADRKSRISQLKGFRFFTLLKRVQVLGADYSKDGDEGNYVSMTVWEDKDCFDEWRYVCVYSPLGINK